MEETLHRRNETTVPRQIKPRIVMVSITPIKGGGETHDAKLAQLLAERYQIHAIISNPWLQGQMAGLGIPVTRIPTSGLFRRYFLIAIAVLRECLLFRPAVAHLNGQGEAYFAPIFHLFGVRAVIARHTMLNIVTNRLKRAVVSFCYRFGAKIVCVSSVVRRDMEKIVRKDRLVTISNWLMDKEISQPRQFHPTDGPLRLLFVGRLLKIKGVHDLLAAMKRLDRCMLEVVGDGPEREELIDQARGLPVTFRGVVNDCTPFYDHADLLVFPSYPFEGQGQTPLEAMGRGLPCLMSDIEVAQETCDRGKAAALFHSGDIEDLTQKIEQLKDARRLTELSRAGFERIHNHYSESVVQPLYFQIFDELSGA